MIHMNYDQTVMEIARGFARDTLNGYNSASTSISNTMMYIYGAAYAISEIYDEKFMDVYNDIRDMYMSMVAEGRK